MSYKPVQFPLPGLAEFAYPRGDDGVVHQCAWCHRVLDRRGRFRIRAGHRLDEASHGCCSICAVLLRPSRTPGSSSATLREGRTRMELTQDQLTNLRLGYQEVCKTHQGIADFRAKLLGFLPLASGPACGPGWAADLRSQCLCMPGWSAFLVF